MGSDRYRQSSVYICPSQKTYLNQQDKLRSFKNHRFILKDHLKQTRHLLSICVQLAFEPIKNRQIQSVDTFFKRKLSTRGGYTYAEEALGEIAPEWILRYAREKVSQKFSNQHALAGLSAGHSNARLQL